MWHVGVVGGASLRGRGHDQPVEHVAGVEACDQRQLLGLGILLAELFLAGGRTMADDDELLAGARRRDVEQSQFLFQFALPYFVADDARGGRGEPAAVVEVEIIKADAVLLVALQRIALRHLTKPRSCVEQEHDREFETLGRVDCHDLHSVFADGDRGLGRFLQLGVVVERSNEMLDALRVAASGFHGERH